MARIPFEQLPKALQDQVIGQLQLPDRAEASRMLEQHGKKSNGNSGKTSVGFVDLVKAIGLILLASMMCCSAVMLFAWLCASLVGLLGE